MPTAREQAEQIADREEHEARNRKIARLQADIEVRENGQRHSQERNEQRAAWYREHRDQVRERAIVAFGEIGEKIDLRLYHLLSLEGQARCFLFLTRDRLEDARLVAERCGLGVDSYADHIPVTAQDLPDRWDGQILAIDPTNEEIQAIARKIDEQARKGAGA